MALNVLSAGAAKGLWLAAEATLLSRAGIKLNGTYGAVGAMQEKLAAGEPCDVIVLTGKMIADLAMSGAVLSESVTPLGRVRTGIAVRKGETAPAIDNRAVLRANLLAAQAVFVPDLEKSTAGRHFVSVLESLGIAHAMQERLRAFPNGAAAMSELASSSGRLMMGCTQVSEILYTPGVALVGPLPREFELATLYAAAVTHNAADPAMARRVLSLLGGQQAAALRERAGFEPPTSAGRSG